MILPEVRIFGASADLVLVVVLAVAYNTDPETGAVTGFAGGFLLDLFLRTPLGVSALTFAVVGYGVAALRGAIIREGRGMAPLVAGVGGFVGGGLYLVLASLLGQEGLLTTRSLRILVAASLLDALIAPFVFPLVRRVLAAEPDRAAVR